MTDSPTGPGSTGAAEAAGQRSAAELRRLAEMPDGAHLPEQSREFTDLPATRYCATPGGLRDLLGELNVRFGGTIGRDKIEKELAGAQSAAAADQALGYRKIRFGLQVTASQGKPAADGVPPTHFKVITEFRDPAWPVPKIGLGCIAAAHVRHGAPGDNLRDLGYRDLEDVAARARAYTARTGIRLPVAGERATPFRPGHDPALMPVVAVAFSRPMAGQGTTTPGIRPGRIDFPEPVTTAVESVYRAGGQGSQRRPRGISQVARAVRERLARTTARPGSPR